jgi:hypothetical protein
MRMAFGLVGVLVTLGVIIWIMSVFTLPTAKVALQQKKKTEETLGALTSSGIQETKDSMILDPVSKGSRFDCFRVKGILPGGPMQVQYGLTLNDEIVGVQGLTFDTTANGDPDLAEALIWEARGKQQSLMVRRNGVRLELPWQPPPKQVPGNTGADAGDGAGVKESPLARQVRIQTH